jgi:hypothetical protein
MNNFEFFLLTFLFIISISAIITTALLIRQILCSSSIDSRAILLLYWLVFIVSLLLIAIWIIFLFYIKVL